MSNFLRAAIVILSAPLLCLAQGVIKKVAGLPSPPINGDIGDGGPATRAFLGSPSAVTSDAAGNIYIWGSLIYRIRKVNTSGVISTVAGTGANGSGGDGGPATSAQLGVPVHAGGLATDSAGNLYIAGGVNNRVRKVDTSGKITTVAGNGASGVPGSASGDGQQATSVPLCTPSSVATDAAGNLYIGSSVCYTIRKVDTSGVISTVAGSGRFGFSGDGGPATEAAMGQPAAIAADSAGNLYFADGLLASRVRKVTTDGTISTIAGTGTKGFSGDGGPALSAQFDNIGSLAVDGAGNVFIADSQNGRIRKVDTSGNISTVVGGGTQIAPADGASATTLRFTPSDVAVDLSGNLLVPDDRGYVYKVSGVAAAGPPPPPATGSVAKTVSAAGLQGGPIAAEAVAIATGTHLATGSATGDLDQPPTALAGTTVNVTDSAGVTRPAALFSVSSGQVVYQIPPGTAAGTATVAIRAGDGVTATTQVQVAAVAPGLYTLNSSGLVKGYVLRLLGGNVFIEDVYEIDTTGAIVARPITISNGDQVTLIAYGAGFRAAGGDISATVGGISAPILFAGPQGVQLGLDQFNVLLPPELATGGPQTISIMLTAAGQPANTVTMTIQ